MSLTTLGVLANMALAATAVLLPPTMTASDLGDAQREEVLLNRLLNAPSVGRVALNCDDCPYATKDDERVSWTENPLDAGNTFSLDLKIGSNEHTLAVGDGYQLFPPNMNEGKPSFYVTQLHPGSDEPLDLLVTGYTFRYNGAETISEAGLELLPMTLQISSVEGVSVSPPLLTINVLKDTEGRLSIASLRTSEISETAPSEQADCNEWPLLCKWKAIVAERIEKMRHMGKGCHKRPHGQHNPMAEETFEGKPPHRFHPGRPHHHHPHHLGHGHGHRHHRMHTFARRAFFTIFIPIVVGIFAGTVTYLIGMVLGTIIAIIIAKVRGECCFMGHKFERLPQEEDVEEGETEIESQSEKQDYAELPAYDAPPVYEEAAEVKVDASK